MNNGKNGGNADKTRAAEYIFSEIGLIDDDIIAAACPAERNFRFETQSEKRRAFPRGLAAAAAVAIIIAAVPLSVFVISRISDKKDGSTPNETVTEEPSQAPKTVGQALERAAVSAVPVDLSGLSLLDGNAKIIWSLDGGDSFYVVRLSAGEESELIAATLKLEKNAAAVPENAESALRVWICDRNGNVFSPMLKYSRGNIEYGSLYDYMPEIEPDSGYARLIYKLIG